MRAVWTFWSKPFLLRQRFVWYSEKHHLLSWILSVETARQHYPDTVLYTDDAGARMLVDGLGLSFKQVSTALNALVDHDPRLWALGKIYAYRLQTLPFVHLDNDVFLWNRLPDRMETAPLFAQNPEQFVIGKSHYRPELLSLAYVENRDVWRPMEWAWYYADGKRPQRGVACGVFGGNHLEFINYFSDMAIKFVEHPINTKRLLQLINYNYSNDICGLFEEYLLSACIEYHKNSENSPYRKIWIEYLFESMADAYNEESGKNIGYTHLVGVAKKNAVLIDRLEKRVMRDYPEQYSRCMTWTNKSA